MIGLLSLLPLFATPIQSDPVTFSFAFFGCNRVDKADWDVAANPSSANLPQLRQSFQDIAKISPMPKYLFMTGDLVLGYGNDKGEECRKQLDAWISEYKASSLNGKLTMVPISGNHEMNRKVKDEKLASPYTASMWNDWLAVNSLMPKLANGPLVGGPDQISDDQSKLNFSFDEGNVHFVCLNTDTRTKDERIGFVPANWAKADIDAATKAGKTIFLLGHRNVVDGTSAAGDAPIEPKSGGELIKAMQASPNVLAYLCAHVHAWDVSKVNGALPWQIIAGNGGSKLEKAWEPEGGKTYGFAVIEIHQSGTVDLVPYFRPAKDDNVQAAKAAPAIVLGKLVS